MSEESPFTTAGALVAFYRELLEGDVPEVAAVDPEQANV